MEPTPPELGAAAGPPHGLIVEGREQLLYSLGEAAGGRACRLLYLPVRGVHPAGRAR